ncbi:MAG: orotidine-5'-phosphate decarboxylase [Candidatus Kerfeldbacteria bacterium]
MTFSEKLKLAIEKYNSLVCVGIDPNRKQIPTCLWDMYPEKYAKNEEWRDFSVVYRFCVDIVDATAQHCCAFKPNMGFFESFGMAGADVLTKLCAYIKENYPDHVLVLDGKRGDIGNTADHYALSLKELGADVVTVNPYLGPHTLEPFLKAGLGIIALCVTSNKDATIFQNVSVLLPDSVGDCADRKIPYYLWVAEVLTKGINFFGYEFKRTEIWEGQLGLVTGATHPKELGEVRQLVGNEVVLLIPGIGKQEGNLKATVENNGDGLAMINVSRSVLYASNGEDYATAAAAEAEKTKNEINKYRTPSV